MKRSRIRRLAAITASVMLAAFGTLNSRVGTRRASASTLTVTNTADSGAGSLRDAVANANSGDTIMFNLALPATITLTSGQISIGKSLTISGPGATQLTVSGNNASRVFGIPPSSNVSISGLTIANGTDAVDGKGGGAIQNQAILSLANCGLKGNSVNSNQGFGGAIQNSGTLSVTNSFFGSNKDMLNGGGAISSVSGSVQVSNCNFTANQAADTGGAISIISGSLSCSGCTFASNQTFTAGGAIFTDSGSVTASNCGFSSNSVIGSGQFFGGAIANNTGGTLAVTACEFDGNSAPSSGAIFTTGPGFTALNSTFSSNSATAGGAGGLGIYGGTNNVINCTISGNSAPSSVGGGIAITSPATLNLENTIIAGNTGGDCVNQGGTIATNSHNLVQDGSCNPMLSGSPKLGPLQNNGGPTSTMALLASSPCMDAGDDSVLGSPFSLTTDQRGPVFPRKSGAHVDIGAFEVQVPVPVGPAFDSCLKDNTSGNLLQWNSTTGQYQFTRCSDNFILTGTGAVALVNGIRTLKDFKTDRRISAGFNTGQLTGSATIYLMVAQGVWQTFRIIDTNPSAVCKC